MAESQDGTDTIGGETVEWDAPAPNNRGPRSITSNEARDRSIASGRTPIH
jgi:hypothetical protein